MAGFPSHRSWVGLQLSEKPSVHPTCKFCGCNSLFLKDWAKDLLDPNHLLCLFLKKHTKWAKDFNRHFTEEGMQMTNTWKDAPHRMSSGTCKIKRDTTTCLCEWPKSRTLTTPNGGEGVEPQGLIRCGGAQNGNGHVGRQFGRCPPSPLPKTTLTIQSGNHAFWCLIKGIENVCPFTNLHVDVYLQLFVTAQAWK